MTAHEKSSMSSSPAGRPKERLIAFSVSVSIIASSDSFIRAAAAARAPVPGSGVRCSLLLSFPTKFDLKIGAERGPRSLANQCSVMPGAGLAFPRPPPKQRHKRTKSGQPKGVEQLAASAPAEAKPAPAPESSGKKKGHARSGSLGSLPSLQGLVGGRLLRRASSSSDTAEQSPRQGIRSARSTGDLSAVLEEKSRPGTSPPAGRTRAGSGGTSWRQWARRGPK